MSNAEVSRPDERNPELRSRVADEYRWGFVTDIEQETVPKGLNEDVIRLISAKKNEPEFMLEWRLTGLSPLADADASRPGRRCTIRRSTTRPSTTTPRRKTRTQPKNLAEVDPELLRTYEKLGIPLHEREALAGVAVDAVFDSVSVATTFKDKLESLGIIFCSFSEAVQKHPELVREYLGSVVPYTDNYFATLNSAVFTDGSFVYVPKGVRCPMELSTYFRINASNTGQFERTLIIADEGAERELPGRLHRADARREPVARGGGRTGGAEGRPHQVFHRAELVSRRPRGAWRHLQLRHQARRLPRRPRAHLLDPGRDRLGHHLEIPELHPARRRQRRRVLFGGPDQPPPAGRHRHQDDPHRQEHPQHHRFQGHLGRPRQQRLSRPGEGAAERRPTRATTPSATRC